MNPLLLGPLFELGKGLIDRIIPDKEKAAEAERAFMQMAMEGELKQVIAQLEINAKEAASPSIFVAGWRPFFGWIGGICFLYAVLFQPFFAIYAQHNGLPQLPDLNMDLMWVVITGMLGIGGLRTYEKTKGVAAK
jgi:hypothetical protein